MNVIGSNMLTFMCVLEPAAFGRLFFVSLLGVSLKQFKTKMNKEREPQKEPVEQISRRSGGDRGE
jgi:hypothetical protein